MNNLRNRSLNSQIAAIRIHAGVIGEALGVAAKVEFVVGLIKIAEAGDEFGLIVALEAGTGNNVEDAVRSISKLSAVAAAINLHVVDVLRIELRAEIGSNVGVGNGDAVNEPTGLMSAANVQLVVGDVGAGDVIRDHGEAVAASSPGSLGEIGRAAGRESGDMKGVGV